MKGDKDSDHEESYVLPATSLLETASKQPPLEVAARRPGSRLTSPHDL